ncbi:prefoldin subunit beta [Candidatus Woesearchaeota archaeon]|nr:prefoldin subunit beta [Candidatus Woesearchaeota archaeon]
MADEEKIAKLQLLEQNLQNFLMQRQAFQGQLLEIESALEEIGKTDAAFRIIGNIMVKGNKEELKKDLQQKKEMLDLRIKNLEKQEEKIKEKVREIRLEVLKEMENEKRGAGK